MAEPQGRRSPAARRTALPPQQHGNFATPPPLVCSSSSSQQPAATSLNPLFHLPLPPNQIKSNQTAHGADVILGVRNVEAGQKIAKEIM